MFNVPFGPPTWPELLEHERLLRSQLGEGCNRDDLRAWYGVASVVMEVCGTESRSGRLSLSPPSDLFIVFSKMAGELARGIVPRAISDVQGAGRPGKSGLEEENIGYATIYLRLAKAGRIMDAQPVETIRQAFGVERQVAQRWKSLEIPARLVQPDYDTSYIVRQMKLAGKTYQEAGRSVIALTSRTKR